ncbi:hypothetical protein HK096_000946 [Nowakowskiella sp. JEL0078]|nr:hypothetical protein HK096_000946 [Nowakowskiella sp. JEL0078]
MANRTVADAKAIHGTNPQNLIEKIVRNRIYDSVYWKEHSETILDKAIQLNHIGGQYGSQKPTEFLCLTLKLLQIQPEREIVLELLKTEEEKYLRALAAFYLRLTGSPQDIYSFLEPLLYDSRKLRRRLKDGSFDITFMDEFIDTLLTSERVCDTILPFLTKRHILEESVGLEPRVSPLEDELNELEQTAQEKAKEKEDSDNKKPLSRPDRDQRDHNSEKPRRRSRSSENRNRGRPDKYQRDRRSRSREREKRVKDGSERRDYDRDKDRDEKYRKRSSRSPESRSRDYDRRKYHSHKDRKRSLSPNVQRDRSHSPVLDIEDKTKSSSKTWSSKKVNGLFKKTPVSLDKINDQSGRGGNSGSTGGPDSLSIDETNKMREKLGLKPLK